MTRTDTPSIKVQNLVKRFGEGEPVLKGVSIEFEAGKLTYILGPSGTGKSVLLKHILGLLYPDSGEIFIGARNVTRLKAKALKALRKEIGVVFQNSALFDDMSVFENVAFPLRERGSINEKTLTEKVHSTLSHLGMTSGYEKLPSELSGGMRKRVGLARAVIDEPSILLYDEPTTGLDPITRETVDELILTLKKELSVTSIVISHDLASALENADKIVFLSEGKVLFDGNPKAFRSVKDPTIRKFLDAELKRTNTLSEN